MRISFKVPQFHCPKNMIPHLEKVFFGEYDIPHFVMPKGEVPTILDLGANCGAFSIWAAHRFPRSLIHAYEPDSGNIEYFRKNTHNYPCIELHEVAVGSPGVRILYDGRFNCGEHSLYEVTNNPMPTGKHVEVISPLELPEADIIKLDIEGCELEVLGPLLSAGRSFSAILFEYHSEYLRREIDSLLKDYHLVGSIVEHPIGRGVVRYIHNRLVGGL